jgi:hypothetical protein
MKTILALLLLVPSLAQADCFELKDSTARMLLANMRTGCSTGVISEQEYSEHVRRLAGLLEPGSLPKRCLSAHGISRAADFRDLHDFVLAQANARCQADSEDQNALRARTHESANIKADIGELSAPVF